MTGAGGEAGIWSPIVSRSGGQGDRRILLGLILLAVGLRLYGIGAEPIWLDEAYSLWIAQHPISEIWPWLARIDQHPPLYYWLLALWIPGLGDSEYALRFLSAAAGTLTVPILHAVGTRLGGRRIGQLSAALLAVSPFHIQYGQEARMYALLALAVALIIFYLAQILTGSDGLRSWAGLVLAELAALWLHNTAIFVVVAVNGTAIGWWFLCAGQDRSGPGAWRNWFLSQGLVGLLWSPWLPALASQIGGIEQRFWIPAPTWSSVPDTLAQFNLAFLPQGLPWSGLWAAPFWAMAALGAWTLRRQSLVLICLLSLLVTPLVGELAVSLRRPIYLHRTLIGVSLPYFLLVAWGVQNGLSRYLRQPLLVLLTILPFLALHDYYRYPHKEQWREAATYVAQGALAGDLVLFSAGWVQIPFDYYFRPVSPAVAEAGLPVDLFERHTLEPAMTAADLPRLRQLAYTHDQIWLVLSHTGYSDPNQLVTRELMREWQVVERGRWIGIDVIRLRRRAELKVDSMSWGRPFPEKDRG